MCWKKKRKEKRTKSGFFYVVVVFVFIFLACLLSLSAPLSQPLLLALLVFSVALLLFFLSMITEGKLEIKSLSRSLSLVCSLFFLFFHLSLSLFYTNLSPLRNNADQTLLSLSSSPKKHRKKGPKNLRKGRKNRNKKIAKKS